MHPRSIYKDNPPDFRELAIKYPYFREHCRENTSGGVNIDFKDPAALRALTCALLENDFDLRIEIPLDRLIPTVPLRLNYLLWIEDLVECLAGRESQTDVTGLDIGTGSSCIYPLLGARINGWKFLATEVDQSSLKYAEDNVKRNGLADKISVHHVSPGSYLQKPLADAIHHQVTFCMCNPPFFSSEDEAAFGSARTDKRPLPLSVNTGSATETVTSGGEVEFVKQIIDDSLQLKEKVSWYTTMVGKKTSVKSVLAYLQEKKVPTITTTTFTQGKTMRWGVAWTFLQDISVDAVSPPPAKRPRKQNKPLSFVIQDDCAALESDDEGGMFAQVVKLIKGLLVDLKLVIEEHQSGNEVCSYRCSASQITWAQQRKKRRELQRLEHLSSLDKNKLKDEENCETQAEDRKGAQNERGKFCSPGTSNGKKTELENEKKSGDSSKSVKCIDNSNSNQRTLSGNLIKGLEEQGLEAENQVNTSQSDDTDSGDVVKTSLCSFWVRISTTAAESKQQTVVEVECIQANNKNHVYQLYQYLQNKILQGK